MPLGQPATAIPTVTSLAAAGNSTSEYWSSAVVSLGNGIKRQRSGTP